MLEFVDSGLYFVQDVNNFINTLLQVGSGSVDFLPAGSGTFFNGAGSGIFFQLSRIRIRGKKCRILIPVNNSNNNAYLGRGPSAWAAGSS